MFNYLPNVIETLPLHHKVWILYVGVGVGGALKLQKAAIFNFIQIEDKRVELKKDLVYMHKKNSLICYTICMFRPLEDMGQ